MFHSQHTEKKNMFFFLLIETTLECPQRQCRLAFLCWMEGGNTQQGCGYNSWLYSCCLKGSQSTHKDKYTQYQSALSPQLSKRKRHHDDGHAVQKKFQRRRYDTSESHLVPPPNCGVPRTPSNVIQRRIIGGRPAYFAGAYNYP